MVEARSETLGRRRLRRARRLVFAQDLFEVTVRTSLWFFGVVWVLSAALLPTSVRIADELVVALWTGSVALIILRTFRQRSEQRELRWLEARNPEFAGYLVNAHAFSGLLLEHVPGFSSTLIRRHLEETDTRLAKAQGFHGVARRRTLRAILAVLLVIDLFYIKALGTAVVEGRPLGRSPFLFATLQRPEVAPRVLDLDLLLSPPDYSGLPTRRLSNTDGNFSALRGTVATLRVHLTVAVEHLGIVLPDQFLDCTRTSEREYEIAVPVNTSGPYHFRTTDAEGGETVLDGIRKINVIPDLPPSASITFPAKDLELKRGDSLEIAYSLEDDFPLQRAWLVHGKVGQQDRAKHSLSLDDVSNGRSRIEGRTTLHLRELELEDGDRLEYAVEVEDRDALSGPKTSSSTVYTITVGTLDETIERHLAEQQRLRDMLVDQLGGALNALIEPSAVLGATMRSQLERLTAIEQVLLGLLSSQAEDEVFSEAVTEVFETMTDRLRLVRDRLSSRIEAGLWTVVRMGLPEDIGEYERDILAVEQVRIDAAGESVQDLIERIHAMRERLSTLVQRYRTERSKALLDEIERLIKQLVSSMRKVQERFAEVARHERLDELINREALERHTRGDDLEDLQRRLREGDVDGALEAADRYFAELSTMLDELSQPLDAEGQESSDRLIERLGRFAEELTVLSREQREVHDGTERLAQLDGQASSDRLAESIQEALLALGEAIEAFGAEPLAHRTLQTRHREMFWKLRRGQARMQEVVRRQELYQIPVLAEPLLVELREYGTWLSTEMANVAQASQAQHESERTQVRLAALLALFEKQTGSGHGLSEQRRVKEFEARQEQLAEDHQDLVTGFEQMVAEEPAVGAFLAPGPSSWSGDFDQAQRYFEEGRLEDALVPQRAILENIGSLLEKLDQAKKGAKEKLGRGQRRRTSIGKQVRIPEKTEDKRGEALRKELADAQREPVPARYEQLIRKYFERIVR